MSRKDVSINHPMASERQRNKAKDILEGTKQVFEKVEERQKQEDPETRVIEPKKVRNIRDLLFAGHMSKVVEVDGFYFKLKTLNNEENRDLAKKIIKLPEEDRLSFANTFALAASIEEINGLSLSDAYKEVFEVDSEEGDFEKALVILSKMNANLVGKLISEYMQLNESSRKIINPPTKEAADEESKDLKK